MASKDRDLLTKLMGDYLLKGYTMLDEYCETCLAPMMKRKGEDSFCVNCQDVNKPKEMEVETASASKVVQIKPDGVTTSVSPVGVQTAIESVIASAANKLNWTSAMLQESSDIQQCLLLNQLMQSTMDTLEKAFRFRNNQ